MNYLNAFDSTLSGNAVAGKPSSGLDAFDTASRAPDFQPLPAGRYEARIVNGSMAQTKRGDDAYRMTFEVSDGEHCGRRVSRTWVFTEKAIGYAKRDLEAFGLLTSRHLLDVFPPVGVEVYCRITVALQRSDDGREFNDVKRIDVLRIDDSPAKQFLIDPASEGIKS